MIDQKKICRYFSSLWLRLTSNNDHPNGAANVAGGAHTSLGNHLMDRVECAEYAMTVGAERKASEEDEEKAVAEGKTAEGAAESWHKIGEKNKIKINK